MKSTIYIFLFIGFTHLYSQNVNLKQLIQWRQTNYEIVDKELLKMGWKKSIPKATDNYKECLYFLNKGSINEKVLRLMYTVDYELKSNTISYSIAKDVYYDDLINQIKSRGFSLFKSIKSENVISDYYKSDTITIIVSVLKGIDQQMREIQFLTIYLSTNEDYYQSHKE